MNALVKQDALKIRNSNGIFILEGRITENADFSILEEAVEPLRLNMRGVSQINSTGVMNFLRFLDRWGARPFEYHECHGPFLEQLTMISVMFGPNGAWGKLISFLVPYECMECGSEKLELWRADDPRLPLADFEFPVLVCPSCSREMTAAIGFGDLRGIFEPK